MLRRLTLFAVLAATALGLGAFRLRQSHAQSGTPAYRNPNLPVGQRVADLLSRMTLDEKVAQTHALWKGQERITDAQGNFSPEKAREVLQNGIGEITRAGDTRKPRENAEYTNAIQKYLVEQTRLGIPAIIHEESLHGLVAPGATSFPQAIALASTWDEDLVEKAFGVAALEGRSRGAQQVLTPVLDLARDPRWGRTEETYGEDPYLVSRMGVACIRGFQGDGPTLDRQHVYATMKHFAVHGQPEGGRNSAPANYSKRIVVEDFLAPFRAAVTEAKVMSVMPSYNEVNGIPSHANRWLLQQMLREEWGFQGIAVSDYDAINQLETFHHVVGSKADAARKALETGVDIELPDIDCYGTLVEQIQGGRISEATLDKAVARILRAKFLAGLFENPYVDPENAVKVNNSPEHQQLALRAAREAIVLLKNQGGLLPLDRNRIRSLAVIGPNATPCRLGGYSADPGHCVTVLDGIKAKVGDKIKVNYALGAAITENDTGWRGWYEDKVEPPDPAKDAKRIAEAVEIAKASDVAVLFVGGNEQTCREAWAESHLGDRDSLDLVGRQNDLVKAVLETGKPVVVFLMGGRPLSINFIAEKVPAILEGWYLGQEGGTAVADVLFGDYNPAGRLPITFPRSVGQLPDFYNHKPSTARNYLFAENGPLFPFGFGLSYTTFKYDNLRLTQGKIGTRGATSVKVDVTNTGKMKGDEIVEMYIRDLVSSVTRPVKELKGFKRVTLDPGQTVTVEFPITPAALSFLDLNMHRVVEPGEFDIMVGPNSVELQTAKLSVED
jgi:beta-glucosidase